MKSTSGFSLMNFAGRCCTFLLALLMVYSAMIMAFSRISFGHVPLIFHMTQGLVLKGGYTHARLNQFRNDHPYDILIFGSSRANRGIDPAVLEAEGYSAYNLGTDDQTPINTEVMVKHFTKQQKPKLVIIDVFHLVFTTNPLPSSSDIIMNAENRALAFNMLTNSGDIRMVNSFAVRMALRDNPPVYESTDTLYNGFRRNKQIGDDLPADRFSFHFRNKSLESFDQTLCWLECQKIPYLLVAQPEYPGADKRYVKAFAKAIAPVLQQHKATIYNLNETDLSIGKNSFSDYIHLNTEGARIFTTYLVQKIRNTGV